MLSKLIILKMNVIFLKAIGAFVQRKDELVFSLEKMNSALVYFVYILVEFERIFFDEFLGKVI